MAEAFTNDDDVIRQFVEANEADDDAVDAMLFELFSSSDEEEGTRHQGSAPGRALNKKRDST